MRSFPKTRIGPRDSLYVRPWLKKDRMALGLSQYKIAEECGISQGHYNQIEMGVTTPSIYVALAITNALGEKPDIWLSDIRVT